MRTLLLLAAALAGCAGPRLDYKPRVNEKKASRLDRVIVVPFADATGRSRDDAEAAMLPPPAELASHCAAYLKADGFVNAASALSEAEASGDVIIRGRLVRLDDRQAAAYVEAVGAGGWPLWRGDVAARGADLSSVLDALFEKIGASVGAALDKRR